MLWMIASGTLRLRASAPLPREGVLLGQQLRALCTSRLNWKTEKMKRCVQVCPCLFPLVRGSEWGPDYVVCRAWDML